jgi:hypothetical protein
MTKIERFAETATGFDVFPIVKARPLITPPRTGQPDDPPMYAFWCPHRKRVEILVEEITIWPAMVRCAGRPVILTLGRAVFVGAHLLVRSKRDRLLQVLQQTYGDDVLVGSRRAWIETAGVRTDWRPASQQTKNLFRDAGLFGRSRAPAKPTPTTMDQLEPELIA